MRTAMVAVGAICIALLQGCSPTVRLEPAERANSPECANMMVRLPDTVADLPRRGVNAQSTAAWGDPVAVIVRCGMALPGPSTLPCVTMDGVDWLINESDRPRYLFLTFGLDPATEVIIDSDVVSGTRALEELAVAIGSQSAPVAQCVDATDVRS